MTDLGKLAEQMKELDITGSLRAALGKCPKCGTTAVRGHWLKWCPKRCAWQVPA